MLGLRAHSLTSLYVSRIRKKRRRADSSARRRRPNESRRRWTVRGRSGVALRLRCLPQRCVHQIELRNGYEHRYRLVARVEASVVLAHAAGPVIVRGLERKRGRGQCQSHAAPRVRVAGGHSSQRRSPGITIRRDTSCVLQISVRGLCLPAFHVARHRPARLPTICRIALSRNLPLCSESRVESGSRVEPDTLTETRRAMVVGAFAAPIQSTTSSAASRRRALRSSSVVGRQPARRHVDATEVATEGT